MKHWRLSIAAFVAAIPMANLPLRAQSVDVNVALTQSFTSVESVGSPIGWRVGMHAPSQLGRFGFQAGYRYLHEGRGEIPGYCGAFNCVNGPFEETAQLGTLDFGIMYSVIPGLRSNLNLGVAGSYSWQNHRLRHLSTGEISSHSKVGPDFGVGVFAEARIPPLALGLQPVAFARYDRIAANECLQDASCFDSRHVATLGIGIAWGAR
jgi:hypothetical protein